jgi:hypothetical protein
VEGLIMNALEQEYADNVKRATRRESLRVIALVTTAIGLGVAGAIVGLVVTHQIVFLVFALIGLPFGCAERYLAYRTRFVVSVQPDDDAPIQIEGGYRDAPRAIRRAIAPRPSKKVVIASIVAVYVVSALGAALVVADPSSRYAGRLIVVLGAVIVVTAQQLYAVWKKRHDAKLMLEWERRLEEMK